MHGQQEVEAGPSPLRSRDTDHQLTVKVRFSACLILSPRIAVSSSVRAGLGEPAGRESAGTAVPAKN